MRLQPFLVLLVVLVGICAAQETNFPVGPQYLVTMGNPMLLRPIATPSLSLGEQTLAGTTEVPRPVELPAFAPDETIVYLGKVYWGDHQSDAVFSRRLDPPTMTADQTAWYMNYVASQTAAAQSFSMETAEAPAAAIQSMEIAQTGAGPQVIELTGGPMPANLPSSIFDTGVTGMTDAPSLLQRKYGLSLGEVAAYWKTHKRYARRVFTNQDMHRP
jgi:hypothetical protein